MYLHVLSWQVHKNSPFEHVLLVRLYRQLFVSNDQKGDGRANIIVQQDSRMKKRTFCQIFRCGVFIGFFGQSDYLQVFKDKNVLEMHAGKRATKVKQLPESVINKQTNKHIKIFYMYLVRSTSKTLSKNVSVVSLPSTVRRL